MSYTDSGFDKRVRNLLAALETAAPPPPPPAPPTGSVIRLRISDVTEGDAEPISTAPDSSGNGYNFSQAGAERPLCVENAILTNKAAFFDGTRWMNGPASIDFSGATGFTVCAVFYLTDGIFTPTNLLSLRNATPWTLFSESITQNLGIYSGVANRTGDATVPPSSFDFANVQFPLGFGVPTWYRGENAIPSEGSIVAPIDLLTTENVLGAFSTAGSSGFVGLISEVIVYNREFDAADRAEWAAYVASQYGL